MERSNDPLNDFGVFKIKTVRNNHAFFNDIFVVQKADLRGKSQKLVFCKHFIFKGLFLTACFDNKGISCF